MKRFRLALLAPLAGVLVSVSCAGPRAPRTLTPPAASPTTAPATVVPAESATPVPEPTPVTPSPENWQPAPGDERMERTEVQVETADVVTLESDPPQYQLRVTGWKGTPCHQVRVKVDEPDASQRILVEVYALLEPDRACIQRLDALELNIPLGSYDAGEYTVWLNGEQVGTISAP